MAALIDFAATNRPPRPLAELDVPIAELAKRVVALYWRQTRPFEGAPLRQSTQSASRILQSVEALRSLVGSNEDMSLSNAAQIAPALYQRAVDEIMLCLAQQPLPRLQRLPGQAKSLTFLYADSFLHDKVTRSELQRHNNAIRLRLGVADGLAKHESRLTRLVRDMWIDDILRLNRLPSESREDLERHLFEPLRSTTNRVSAARPLDTSAAATGGSVSTSVATGGLTTPAFASRLNYLFGKIRGSNGQPYSSGEIAAKVRHAGVAMSVSTVSQLRSGVGQAPSRQTVDAIARAFGVAPSYFDDGRLSETSAPSPTRAADDPTPTGIAKLAPPAADTRPAATHATRSDRAFLDDMEDIASACAIRPNGCWLAPSNEAVLCRTRRSSGDVNKTMDMALHRWSWMVDHGLTSRALPVDLIKIRRTCDGETCCNPQHLRAANVLGESLTPRDVAMLMERMDSLRQGGRNRAPDEPTPPVRDSTMYSSQVDVLPPPVKRTFESTVVADTSSRLPLKDSLESIAAYCTIDSSGCWVIPKTASVPCRALGDDRPEEELPKIAPHRWAWMVANGFASKLLPSSSFQVWKNCGNRRCCNPEHLYLTNPDGEESSAEEAEEWLRSLESREEDSEGLERMDTADTAVAPPIPRPEGGRHRAPEETISTIVRGTTSDGPTSLAGRLNELFDDYPQGESGPVTSADVAAALQEDGLTVSKESIDRIRSGATNSPNTMVLGALAYFFNVDLDYFFSRDSSSDKQVSHDEAPRREEPDRTTTPSTRPVDRHTERPHFETTCKQIIPITVEELGRIVIGLSAAASECLARNPADIDRAARLALAITEVGTLIARPSDSRVISRPLLARIVKDWTAVGYVSHSRESMLPRLTALLESN
ncbi:hypothetical protein [Mycolicibacterium arseniciresistens]|uniref:HTH cro/C1-type domain-containing protein n=1 Tax=Mycolicibacterium arseniciresistens TaxID=3062257 RepID=A0ABT8UB92_9MYCO|nr:hypothetical protein [Mycolicibacterium arseniciresistens]MDO3634451.1 hypothetical protein [Mycolicibacterium arseniciresistens]